jgi:hypothetical protein
MPMMIPAIITLVSEGLTVYAVAQVIIAVAPAQGSGRQIPKLKKEPQ